MLKEKRMDGNNFGSNDQNNTGNGSYQNTGGANNQYGYQNNQTTDGQYGSSQNNQGANDQYGGYQNNQGANSQYGNYQNNMGQMPPYPAPIVNNSIGNKANGLQVAGLVCGILAICACCCYGVVSIVLGIAGLICAITGNSRGKHGVGVAALVYSQDRKSVV